MSGYLAGRASPKVLATDRDHRSAMKSTGQTLPTVSVVIRTRNESQHLPRLLERLRDQNHTPLDVIVVDSGSTDGTVEIAETEADKVVRIEPGRFTFGRSLNYGCRVARGDVFALVSAHTYPISNNWLVNLVTPFLDAQVAMVYGRQLPDVHSRLGEARDFGRRFSPHSRVLLDEPVGNNANSAVRASLWGTHHFDEKLTGLEDVEWAGHAQRRGYVVRYAANAPIVHVHDESLRQVYSRFFREGFAWAEIFPHQRQRPATALLEGAAALLRDVRFARRASAPRELGSIAGYRLCASLGAYRGEVDRERRRTRLARSAAARKPAVPSRAVVIEQRGRHVIDEREPPAPQPGEASIRVACVGVCATDREILDGRQHYYASGRARYPIVPGHEYGGVVDAVGASPDQNLVGSRVVGECILGCRRCEACLGGYPSRCRQRREVGVLDKDGAYATHVVLPVHAIHRIPGRLPLLQAVLIEPIAVVLSALRKAAVARGQRTAVVGAGPIGHIAANVLRHFGAYVTVFDRDERRLHPLRRLDFSTAVEVSSRDLAGASTVIEATGSREVVSVIAEQSDETARVIVLGSPGEDGEPVLRSDSPAGGHNVIGSVGSAPQDWGRAIEMLSSNRLRNLEDLTDRLTPLEDYEAAWEAVRERSALKTILEVDPTLARE